MMVRCRFLSLAVLLACCSAGRLSVAQTTAGYCECNDCSTSTCAPTRVRPQDQVWVVSTRRLCSACCPGGAGEVDVMRYVGNQQWTAADAAQFYATDDAEAITCVYVHAARVDQEDVTPRAMAVYRNMTCYGGDVPPVRLVVWCWPADKTMRPLDDFRRMAHRSDSEAVYLGRFLSGIRADERVSLVSYSMGARIITGALHLLGGGRIGSCQLDADSLAAGTVHARVVLWAPAVHSDWLYQGRPHEKAVVPLDHMLILYNSCDPVLARYAAIEECYSPMALGYVGITSPGRLGEACRRIATADAACAVGKHHQFTEYLASPWVMQNTRRWALWQESGGEEIGDRK